MANGAIRRRSTNTMAKWVVIVLVDLLLIAPFAIVLVDLLLIAPFAIVLVDLLLIAPFEEGQPIQWQKGQ
jgi:hypothetical protein